MDLVPADTCGKWLRGVCLSCISGCGKGICTRYFSPWNGIGEDPVNGSSHTSLVPLWVGRKPELQLQQQKEECGNGGFFSSYIKSARGGEMRVFYDGKSVKMMGKTVIVLEGKLLV